MPNCVPAVGCTQAQYSSMHTSLWPASVSWHKWGILLPSTLPFHYVIARNAPAMHLALHSKSSTLYGRSNGRKFKFNRLHGLLPFHIVMDYAARVANSAVICQSPVSGCSLTGTRSRILLQSIKLHPFLRIFRILALNYAYTSCPPFSSESKHHIRKYKVHKFIISFDW